VSYQRLQLGAYTVHLIYVNPNDPGVFLTVELARGYPGTDEEFGSMARRTPAVAGITGTYFNVSTLEPICDIVIGGRVVNRGGRGSALCLTADNHFVFRRLPLGRRVEWNGFETVLASGPTILHQGRLDLHPHQEGFKDPHLLGSARRTAVGMTNTGKLAFIGVPQDLTLEELGKLLLRMGFLEAINLDGGTSSAMFYRDQTILSPGRPLVNLLVVYENVPVAQRGKSRVKLLARRDIDSVRHAAELATAARASLVAGRLDEAERALYAAVDADPRSRVNLEALAEVLIKADRRVAASNTLLRLARTALEEKDAAAASAALARSVEANPQNVAALKLQADLAEKAGEAAVAEALRLRAAQAGLEALMPQSTREGRRTLLERLHAVPATLHVQGNRAGTGDGLESPAMPDRLRLSAVDESTIRATSSEGAESGIVTAFRLENERPVEEILEAYHRGAWHIAGPIRTRAAGDEVSAETDCSDFSDGRPVRLHCAVIKKGLDVLIYTTGRFGD
jgi:hypothetical protein